MSLIARTNRRRIGTVEFDAGMAVYDSSAVLGIGVGWSSHAVELWSGQIELSLGPLVLWVRLCHYRKVKPEKERDRE